MGVGSVDVCELNESLCLLKEATLGLSELLLSRLLKLLALILLKPRLSLDWNRLSILLLSLFAGVTFTITGFSVRA